ncbi:MAG TPA: hypothetical protein VIJ22_05680, partial [Polyangiaceae bacterium]
MRSAALSSVAGLGLVVACGSGGSHGAGATPTDAGPGGHTSVPGPDAGRDSGADGSTSDSPSCTATADVYVSPAGTGSACSCAMPCALETGRDKARTLTAGATADVVVLVGDGTYRLAETLTLDATDSGPGGGHVV